MRPAIFLRPYRGTPEVGSLRVSECLFYRCFKGKKHMGRGAVYSQIARLKANSLGHGTEGVVGV